LAGVAESKTTLRIFGDDLDPDEVSRLLGGIPTLSEKKGDAITKKSGTRIARTGRWDLRAEPRSASPEDVDGQIAELLSKLTPDISVWKALAGKYKMDFFVGLFMKESNEGLVVSATTMKLLGERGISLGFDIYSPYQDLPPNLTSDPNSPISPPSQ
jgi:hypothetical protein